MEELKNKQYPSSMETVIRKALSFYPELEELEIEFMYSENFKKSVMQAQPRFVSLLQFWKRRSYIIKIKKQFTLKGEKIPIEELPEDVLIGWIGHELGHIMDYRTKNSWALILFGIGYLTSRSFIISAERTADTYAVNHGLGTYILSTKDFILHKADMPDRYIKKINKLYLPPEEIIEMMERE